MKIYLASRYSRHPEMRAVRDDLKAIGHEVTSRWIEGDHEMLEGVSTQAHDLERIRYAEEDSDDLRAADCVIAFTEEPRTTATRGGRHVEFGMALALGKQIIAVGYRENVFYCLPDVEFYPSWQEALAELRR